MRPRLRKARSNFSISIRHTARTWGVDIEHLILGQIRSWIRKEHWLKSAIYQNSGWIMLAFAVALIGSGWWSTYVVTEHLMQGITSAAAIANNLSIEQKIDHLIALTINSPTQQVKNYKANGYFGSFFLGMFIATIVGIMAENRPKNYLVLSEAAKVSREESLKRRTRGWAYFVLSGLVATTAGVLSRYIFSILFTP